MDDEPTICSSCNAAIQPDATGRLPLQCPVCGEFLIVAEEPEPAAAPATRDDELEGAKIARIARERRGMLRTRSYHLIVLIASAILALELLWYGLREFRRGFTSWAMGEWALGAILLMLAMEMRRRVASLNSRLRQSALSRPDAAPRLHAAFGWLATAARA